jgi:cation diffusion facilitator CzcD-associated flavoprotein CzcO
VRVVVVGAGMSGLCAGVFLDRAGIDYVILEKSPRLGGTWWENTYPGCACDIPSHLYGFSFAPEAWSRVYPSQPEILAYLERVARDYDLERRIRFGVSVREARWDDEACTWTLTTGDGEQVVADAVISCVGALHVPRYPNLPGRETFSGAAFHSATWDHSVDLRGKRVGVIGNGASAIQLIPPVAEQAAELRVFQRSAHWIVPRLDGPYSRLAQAAFRVRPLWRLYRAFLYWRQEILFTLGFRRNSLGSRLLRRHLERRVRTEVADPALHAKLTPDYPPGCKRGLISNDYYPAINRPNVSLVSDPLREVVPEGLRCEEQTYPLDAIVYATGFDPLAWGHLDVYGREGQHLGQLWGQAPRAHLGITVPGFPNYFFLLGPNTGLGHNSVMWMVECQVNYVLRCLDAMRRRKARALEVKQAALDAFYEDLDRGLQSKVWVDCRSWYQNDDGRIYVLWPWSTLYYWWRTRRPKLREFELRP